MRKILFLLLFFLLFLFSPKPVLADPNSISCANRYVTLVNPVRGRGLWSDKTTKPLVTQYLASAKYKMPATWLLQYDALTDSEITKTIKEFEIKGEQGLFLEVSKDMASAAGVDYQNEVKWSSPGNVFLSAYARSDRRRLIDKVYSEFKSVFGHYPKSVGAWWIDSYSLNYIREKYGLGAVLIVADQKTTDSYGVWGQWWGYPYIPSVKNVLVPANGRGLGAVVIQWAQRDPVLAYGGDYLYSNFSLQANDYIRSGKGTDYFESLSATYLDCANPIGQITVGMETGMEAVEFHREYENQLKLLDSMDNLQFVTMSDFAGYYMKVYKGDPIEPKIGDFEMSVGLRTNSSQGDRINYNDKIAFKDYFMADKADFLDRELPVKGAQKGGNHNIVLYIIIAVTAVFSTAKKKFKIWLANLFFLVASLGLIFRSGNSYGWQVYYGPVMSNLYLNQILIYLASFTLFWFLARKFDKKIENLNLFLTILPLSFGIDGVLSILRFTKLAGRNFYGILAGNGMVAGVQLEPSGMQFVYKFIPYGSLKHFLSFPFDEIFRSVGGYLLAYPLLHVLLAGLLYLLMIKLSKKLRIVVAVGLAVFYFIFVNSIFSVDPVAVLPITN